MEEKDFESFYTLRLQPFFEDLKLQGNNASGWSIAGILFLIPAILSFMLNQIIVGILFLIFVIVSINILRRKSYL